MTINQDLLILLDTFGWSRSRVAKEIGVSHVAVIKWLKGAEIREKNCAKLKETVQKYRFHVKPKLTDFPGNIPILRHIVNCGVALEEVSKVSGIKVERLERALRHPTERFQDLFIKMHRVIKLLKPAYAEEKVIDLLDTKPSAPYDAITAPEQANNPFAQNQSPLPDEAKGKDEYNDQVPW